MEAVQWTWKQFTKIAGIFNVRKPVNCSEGKQEIEKDNKFDNDNDESNAENIDVETEYDDSEMDTNTTEIHGITQRLINQTYVKRVVKSSNFKFRPVPKQQQQLFNDFASFYGTKNKNVALRIYEDIKHNKKGFIVPTLRDLRSQKVYEMMEYYAKKSKEFSDKHEKTGQAPVFLVLNLKLSEKEDLRKMKLPEFDYITQNTVNRAVMLGLKSIRANKKINKKTSVGPSTCSSNRCRCDTFAERCLKRPDLQILKYNKFGHLDLTKYDRNKARFCVECSDSCGCDETCPQRSLQRGQQVPLVIMKENEDIGFGLRAGGRLMTGQLVAEVTGRVCAESSIDEDGLKMTFGFTRLVKNRILHVGKEGNVARFINHSCEPNAFFLEVFSRETDTDTFVPRIGVFAIKEIPSGCEITVDYENVFNENNELVLCRCGSKMCRVRVAL